MRMLEVILSSVACKALPNFSILSHMQYNFQEKLLNIKCVFWFSLQCLSETLVILRRTERDIVTNGLTSSCKLPVILVRFEWKFNFRKYWNSGPGSVDGIATAYGMDGPGIESRWDEIFHTSPDRLWGSPSLLYNGYRVFLGSKVLPGRDADPSPPSSAEV